MAAQQSSPRLSSKLETLSYVNGMVDAFKAFDADGDGLIGLAELGGIMASLGYKLGEREAREMMSRGDGDGDGLLSAQEFLDIATDGVELGDGDLVSLLEGALSALDVDDEAAGTTVTGEGLYEVLRCVGRLSLKDCVDIVASMDGDGDGAVNVEDLKLIVQALI